MTLKTTILLSIFTIGVAKSYVFYTEKNVAYLNKQIVQQQKAINLLKVEWTYLNQNSRLQKLATIYLITWHPIEPKQMKDATQMREAGHMKDITQMKEIVQPREFIQSKRSVQVKDVSKT